MQEELDRILYEDTILTVGELEVLNKAVDLYQDDFDWLECIEYRILRSLDKRYKKEIKR